VPQDVRQRLTLADRVAQLAVWRIQRGLTGDMQLLDDLLELRLEPTGVAGSSIGSAVSVPCR
jgi:hypothetical protein